MGTIGGTSSIEIEAPLDAVYKAAADIEASLQWQPEFKAAECLERDDDGNQVLVHVEIDVKVRRLGSNVRFSYAEKRIAWEQEEGPMKSVNGSWEFEDLGGTRTRATYRLDVDLGRKLGLVIRGPLVGLLSDQLIKATPKRLKGFVEGSASS